MSVFIPELLCPFHSAVSPHAEVVQRASVVWAERVGLAVDARARRRLAASRIGWLVARAFPFASRVSLEVAADWTTLFCLLDDRAESMDALSLGAWLARLLKALREGAEAGEDPMEKGLADLRQRVLTLGDEALLTRFAARVEEIFVGFTWESIHRTTNVRPCVDAYRALREVTVGLRPQFELDEITDGIKLPEEVRAHPALRGLSTAACNVVGWANDLFTCERELAEGEVHNLVMVLMDRERLGLDDAVLRVAVLHDEEVLAFVRAADALPSFGEFDEAVARHVGVLRSWIRGHLDWARETDRYRPSRRAVTGAQLEAP